MGPYQLRINWAKHEKITGIDPKINIKIHFFLSLLVKRYFWKPINAKIKGIQFNSPINIKDELFERLFIEFLSIKLKKALINSKRQLVT